jgi:hypothetical protein
MNRLSRLDSSSSSDDDDDEHELILGALQQVHTKYLAMHTPKWGGSVLGRQYIHRDREAGHWRLHNDYFSEAPLYDASFFRRTCAKLSLFLTFCFHQYVAPTYFLCFFFTSGLECLVIYFFA